MPRVIVKIGERYGEWSTVVDAFVTRLMSREEFRAHYLVEYGRSSMDQFERRMERADAKGTSSMLDGCAEDVLRANRCGPGESRIPVSEVIAAWEADSQ